MAEINLDLPRFAFWMQNMLSANELQPFSEILETFDKDLFVKNSQVSSQFG